MLLEPHANGMRPHAMISGLKAASHKLPKKSSALTSILDQVSIAFQMRPDVANLLHGQRRIHQGGRGRRTALFASKKNGGAIPVESRLELAHAIALEGDSNVRRYRTQAICIALAAQHVAYPDFLVETAGGHFEIHEVKPSISHLSTDELNRFDRIEHILRTYRIGFRLIDTKNLASGRALEERLLSYTRGHTGHFTPEQIMLALKVLKSSPLSLLSDAYHRLKKHDLPPFLADYLNFHGQWICLPHVPTQQSRRRREHAY